MTEEIETEPKSHDGSEGEFKRRVMKKFMFNLQKGIYCTNWVPIMAKSALQTLKRMREGRWSNTHLIFITFYPHFCYISRY